MSVTKLRKLQLGREVSAGTACAATVVWRGPASTMQDLRELVVPDENVGYLGPIDRGYFPMVGAQLEIPETELTFEQFPHILEAGVKTATATANGASADQGYIYEYPVATTAAPTIKTYTIETGNDQGAHEMEYGFVETFTLTGAPSEAWKIASTWRGRQKTATTFTSLTPAAVEEALFNKTKLYLDASGGTIGATQKTSTFVGASIQVATGMQAVFTGDGNSYFSFLKCVGADITGSLTLEYDAVGAAMETAFAAGTTYLLRLDILGASLAAGATPFTTKLIRFDAAVKLLSVTPLDSMDGNDTITINWRAVQGNAGQAAPTFTVVNLLGSL